ncbi:4Fe-4S dicluster domain-containing protein [Pseudoramibacter alactolyticus]|uniref:4Fe-4S dicluster domain-containing protein n=1 Tax=Pseudoramibacter alactolyticus TaxID=113287 RepID=UPI002357D20E|nr:4Fe-4S binding protein [Pseudoramibacter alactolyticus]MBM6967369.1 4Fe-4S binding protein [Pseudoramibacter alactolyticus]
MRIRAITEFYFSPTGGTRQTTVAVARAMAAALAVPLQTVDITRRSDRQQAHCFREDDLAIVGMPTYAGRLPNKIAPDLRACLQGRRTPAVAVVTFGNRAYDNALAELCALLEARGFLPFGAAAQPCRHAFSDRLAPGRPDGQDLAVLAAFGRQLAGCLQRGDLSRAAVPGDPDAPYYVPKGMDGAPAKFLKAKPKTDEARCNACGICAVVCPTAAVNPAAVAEVPGLCIKCQACVRRCPTGAKYFDDAAFLSHVAMLEAQEAAPKSAAFFAGASRGSAACGESFGD